MRKLGLLTAFICVAWLAPAAHALPAFYTVLAQGFSGSTPGSSIARVLYEVDFASGGMREIGDIGIEATAFVAEPGTGRLLAWVDGSGAGLYEVDPLTGASTLIGSATSGLGIDELYFTSSGSLRALSNDLSLYLSGPTYEVDLVTAALSPLGGGGYTPVTALTVEPDGGVWLAEGDRLFSSDTGGVFYEHLLGPLYGLAADDTTLFLVGTTYDPGYVVVGSTHYTSAITIEMHGHDQNNWYSGYSVFGVLPTYGNSRRPSGSRWCPNRAQAC